MPRISVICQTVMASGFNMYTLLVVTTFFVITCFLLLLVCVPIVNIIIIVSKIFITRPIN